jgi:hypothetical protein
MSAPAAAVSPPTRKRRVHHKSYSVIGLSMIGFFLFFYWVIARLFVCWGNDVFSNWALFGCHVAHWAMGAMFAIALIVAWLLFVELAALRPPSFAEEKRGRSRDAIATYRQHLTRHERWSSGMAGGLLLLGIVTLLFIVVLPSIRF